MNAPFFSQHWSDETGAPMGGISSGKGFCISWQNGPLGRGDSRKEPNGAFVETIISAVIDRLNYYQGTRFACEFNANAITALQAALTDLGARTRSREAAGTEGTHLK